MYVFDMNPKIVKMNNSKLQHISDGVVEIPTIYFDGAVERGCGLNVNNYIEKFGGEAVTGYLVHSMGYVLIKFIGHVVVKKNGQLFCVTPPELPHVRERGLILFKPSSFEFDDRLPCHTEAIIPDKKIEAYAYLENSYDEIRMRIPTNSPRVSGGIAVPAEYQDIMSTVIAEKNSLEKYVVAMAFSSLDRNSLCACCSGRKYKFCCKTKLKKVLDKFTAPN